jgi:thioredoxin reductase (NADPH)
MKKPIILAVDDDPQVLRALTRDLQGKYRANYRVQSTASVAEALAALRELKQQNETVALLLSDQRMPEMLGVDYLVEARGYFPEAKRVLLTAYSDTDAAIRAINDVQLDYYLMKPWDPPEEKMFPVLDGLLDDWQLTYRPDYEGVKVVGYQFSPRSHEVKDFLSGNLLPYQWLDLETNPRATSLLELHDLPAREAPFVFLEDGTFLTQPGLRELADRLGLTNDKPSEELYDVIIIGAGPAGLSAAVYGASEGLRTLLIEKRAPGGQAGTSSRIENYLGFPSGLSGAELSSRAITQATRFGVEFLSPEEVVEIQVKGTYKCLRLQSGSQVHGKSLVVTTGVNYRRLETRGVDEFTGAGVYYGAATTEARGCSDRDVFVVGGGNSAGQGAMYLSQFARHVYLVIRKPDLSETMSQYLIDQIQSTPAIEVLADSELVEACGQEHLEQLIVRDVNTDRESTYPANALFIFIGARPYTDWITNDMQKDEEGFLITGRDLVSHPDFRRIWKKTREPFPLETCIPGIFAAGDVRADAINRVASAVGEGAMAIHFVHKYLSEV